MATEHWTVYAPGVAVSFPQSLLSINNGSPYVIKIERAGIINSYWLNLTGNIVGGNMSRFNGGYINSDLSLTSARPYQAVPIEALPNDSNNGELPSTVEILSGGKVYGAQEDVFRRFIFSVDEPTGFTSTIDENMTNEGTNIWVDSGYIDSNVQSITLNAGQMFAVHLVEASTSSQVGQIDVWIDFTLERT